MEMLLLQQMMKFNKGKSIIYNQGKQTLIVKNGASIFNKSTKSFAMQTLF